MEIENLGETLIPETDTTTDDYEDDTTNQDANIHPTKKLKRSIPDIHVITFITTCCNSVHMRSLHETFKWFSDNTKFPQTQNWQSLLIYRFLSTYQSLVIENYDNYILYRSEKETVASTLPSAIAWEIAFPQHFIHVQAKPLQF